MIAVPIPLENNIAISAALAYCMNVFVPEHEPTSTIVMIPIVQGWI